MNLGKKLRSLGNKINWPLVTRKRFKTLEANMEAEIKYLTSLSDTRAALARELRATVEQLKTELQEAKKNDHRDPETGRFEKADAPSQDSAGATAGLVS